MKLIELTANIPSFQPIFFNENGLTLIVGTIGEKKQKTNQTYNGVGKSLIVEIVHFCLGSKTNKSFEEHLNDWIFTLKVKINDEYHLITRAANKQNVIFFDDKEHTLDIFKDLLENAIFDYEIRSDKLSFRSLLPRFIRRNNYDYNHPITLANDQNDYDSLIRVAFLLGIDLQLIIKKFNLKVELTRIQKLSKIFKEDPLIKEFFLQSKDEEIELRFLEDKIKTLEKDRSNFQVAENYHQVENDANEVRRNLSELRNEAILTSNSIAAIDQSMHIRPDIPLERLYRVYGELLESFKDGVLQRLNEVEEFHKTLIKNRLARLSQEKIRQSSKLNSLNDRIGIESKKLDALISFMGANKALDELNSLSNQISELKDKAQKIRDYQELNKQYKIDMANIKSAMNNEIQLAYDYLDDTREEFEKNVDSLYRSYVKNFYPNSPAGISIKNNDRDNQVRFDIDVKIENQASDGINHVRIFCFDLLILEIGFNNHMDFIFHDSRLYDGVDPRQRVEMLRLAEKVTQMLGKQYIVTLNQDHIDTVANYLAEDEARSLIESNIVLKLSDESDKTKLLGIQVDMAY